MDVIGRGKEMRVLGVNERMKIVLKPKLREPILESLRTQIQKLKRRLSYV